MTPDLFSHTPTKSACEPIALPGADLRYYPRLLSKVEADQHFDRLHAGISWRQNRIRVYGREHDEPRLTAWHGDPGRIYAYSGIRAAAAPWTAPLLEIKDRIEAVSGAPFNSVLLNLYRNGRDQVGWHADDEPELGRSPVIGSVSLGDARPFQMTSKQTPGRKIEFEIVLQHGSLLLMRGDTQHNWLHQLPRRSPRSHPGCRINLTYRWIEGSAELHGHHPHTRRPE